MPAAAREWFELAIRHDPRSSRLSFEARAATCRGRRSSRGPVPARARSVSPAAAARSARQPRCDGRPDSGPRFEDIADRAGVRFQYDCGATGNLFIGDTMGGGVALFDFDDDGWLDIYFVNGCASP